MGEIVNVVILLLGLVSLISAQNFTNISQEAKLQDFYNLKYLSLPLLLNNVDNYTQEAIAGIQIYERLPYATVLIGLTKILRPYRSQLNNLSAALRETNAARCADVNTMAYVNYTSAVTGYKETEVKLPESPRKIVDAFTTTYIDCSNRTTSTLRTRLATVTGLVNTLKAEYLDKGEQVIRECVTDQCVRQFLDNLRALLQEFLWTVSTQGMETRDVTEVFSLRTFDEDLYSVPLCLYYSSLNAAAAANDILLRIRKCAASFGATVSVQEITSPEETLNLQIILNFIVTYYNMTRQASLPEGELHIFINFLFYEIDLAQSLLNKYDSVDAILAGNLKLREVLRLAAESTNITLKTCVNEAYKYIKADTASGLSTIKACARKSLNVTLSLQASLNASYIKLLTDPQRSDHISQIPSCIVNNLLNTTALNQCFATVTAKLQATLDRARLTYDKQVLSLSEYFRLQQGAGNCKTVQPSLDSIYNCNKTLFAFVVNPDPNVIR